MNMFKLFLFDMDGVLLKNSSSWKYCQEAIGCDSERFCDEFEEDLGRGRDITDLVLEKMVAHGFTQEFLQELARKAPQIRGIGKVLEMVQARRASAVILSGGIGTFAEELSRQYPFSSCVCNDLNFHVDKPFLTCEVKCGNNDKGRIAVAIQGSLGITKEETVAIGDNSNDCLMFAQSGLSIAFNGTSEAKNCADHSVDSDDLSDILPIINGHESGRRKGQ